MNEKEKQIYTLSRISIPGVSTYPMLETELEIYFFTSFDEAEKGIEKLLEDNAESGDTYCFMIEQIQVGIVDNLDTKTWRYDWNGCQRKSSNFKRGDIVEVLGCDNVHLAIVASVGETIKVIEGPGTNFRHSILLENVAKPHFDVPDDLREFYNYCLETAEHDIPCDEGHKSCEKANEPIDEVTTRSIRISFDRDANRPRLIKHEFCRATYGWKQTPVTRENVNEVKDWLTGLLYGKSRLWYLIREYNSHHGVQGGPKLSPDTPLEELIK